MTQNEDQIIKGQLEKMVDTYDSYMKKATFGRETILRQMTVELAGVKTGDAVLEVGCATGTLINCRSRNMFNWILLANFSPSTRRDGSSTAIRHGLDR